MRSRAAYLILAFCVVAITSLIVLTYVAVQRAGSEHGPELMLYCFVSALLLGFAAAAVWWRMDRVTFRPLASLTRDLQTLLQAKRIDRPLRVPERHDLAALPDGVARLVNELRGARREIMSAMATATARVEQEKGWLEMILLELVREAVIVCSTKHKILLYNQPAAEMLEHSHCLGLGRSLFDVLAEAPVRHALEQLEFKQRENKEDLSAPFVCTDRDHELMMQSRVAMVVDPAGERTGYVLALTDISMQMIERQQTESVRRLMNQDLRGPLGSLHAAAEMLVNYPEMDDASRKNFETVIHNESNRLNERLEAAAEKFRGQHEGHWPMAEIHSPDLLSCVARHVHEQGIVLGTLGEPQWLRGDSYSLMVALEELVTRLHEYTGVSEFDVEAGATSARTFLELRWRGRSLSGETLNRWMSEPLGALAGRKLLQVLEDHGSEPWCKRLEDGFAMLRIPLQPPVSGPIAGATRARAARPEFYDFNLLYGAGISEELGKQRLRELSYVVFDTETTGLRPTAGDEIIQIAAVRVTGGRVLESELFDALVNPGRSIPPDSTEFHGITDEMVRDQPAIEAVLARFHTFVGDAVMVAHNAAFDMKCLKVKEPIAGVEFKNPVLDTLLLSAMIDGDDEDHSLDGICERLNIENSGRHSALGDSVATAHVLVYLLERLEDQNVQTFDEVMRRSEMAAQLRVRQQNF